MAMWSRSCGLLSAPPSASMPARIARGTELVVEVPHAAFADGDGAKVANAAPRILVVCDTLTFMLGTSASSLVSRASGAAHQVLMWVSKCLPSGRRKSAGGSSMPLTDTSPHAPSLPCARGRAVDALEPRFELRDGLPEVEVEVVAALAGDSRRGRIACAGLRRQIGSTGRVPGRSVGRSPVVALGRRFYVSRHSRETVQARSGRRRARS